MSFTFEPAVAVTDIDETIDELLGVAGSVQAQGGDPVAWVFDEFQEITRLDQHYPRRWRAVFQRQPDVAHVYLGTSDTCSPGCSPRRTSRSTAPRRWATSARSRWTSSRRSCSSGSRPAARRSPARRWRPCSRCTGGAPYTTQALAYFVWDETPPSGTADRAAFERGLERTLDAETSHYATLWEALTPHQRTLLQALAAESPARPLQDAYRRRHRLGSTSRVQRAADALLGRELVQSEGRGVLAIADPLLARWLSRR